MIILFHDGSRPKYYLNTISGEENECKDIAIQKSLFNLSNIYSDDLILWCNILLRDFINFQEINSIFHHQLIFASFNTSNEYAISKEVGFIDQHCFLNLKKEVQYPTWLMSGDVGGAYAVVIQKSKIILNITQPFSVYLSSFSKLSMPKGLFCYSEPNLLIKNSVKVKPNFHQKQITLFKFVKRHYKNYWVLMLFINELIYHKSFPLIAFINSLFIKKIKSSSLEFTDINVKSSKKIIIRESFNVDVIIPTLGRENHLLNVLKDLSKQIIRPKKVIIVEQNPDENSISELDYIKNDWPFVIDHTFTHQLGACNARNIALSKVTGNWVFFADDDIRLKEGLLSKSIDYINQLGVSSLTISCLQEGEIEKNDILFQWGGFGTNASLVERKYLENCSFKPEHELGYGEDNDFGMQLKNNGCDIIYLPYVKMLHLKAPIGGFRAKFSPKWANEAIQPKPSPTVMAYNLKHQTSQQILGYKTLLFIKFYKKQKIKNPFTYLKVMNKKWEKSVYWAQKMMNDDV